VGFSLQKCKEVKETAEKSRKSSKDPFSCNLLEHSMNLRFIRM